MTGLSRSFFEAPPPGFSETPLMSRRPVVTLATPAQEPEFQKMLAQGRNMRELSAAELKERIPALRPGYAAAAAIEDDTFEMDVAALLQGFLRQLRAFGGKLALRSRAGRIERRAGNGASRSRVAMCFARPSWSTRRAPGAMRSRRSRASGRSACSRSGAPHSSSIPRRGRSPIGPR